MLDKNRWKQIAPYLTRIAPYSNHLFNTALGVYTILTLPDRLAYQPEHIKLETTTRCNLACQFCGRTWATTWAQGKNDLVKDVDEKKSLLRATCHSGKNMDLATFSSLLNQFPRLSKLDVQGMGEPLMNPDFISILELATRRNITTQFFTNATLLTAETAHRLVQQRISEISISLDGANAHTYEFIRFGADFSRVINNIQELVQARRNSGKKKPIIRLAAVMTSHNIEELPDLVRLGHSLGVDQIVATQFKCISSALASWIPSTENLIRNVKESRLIASELGISLAIEFTIPSDRHSKPVPKSFSRCLYPWFSINITIDGDLTPCSYHPLADGWGLGNIYQTSFAKIWNSSAYCSLRHNMRTARLIEIPCNECIDKV